MTSPTNLLDSVLAASEVGIALIDADLTVLLWSRWMADASGIAGEKAVGRKITAIFPEIEGSRLVRALQDALTNGMAALLSSSLHQILLPLFRDGTLPGAREPMKHVVYVKPVTDQGERRCLLQVNDVTHAVAREELLRKQARTMEALAENYRLSELHTRAVLDNTADAIVTFDERGSIESYNPAAVEIFGYPPDEIVGKPVSLLMPRLSGNPGSIGDAVAGFLQRRTEVQGRRKNGEEMPLELSISAMEFGGQRLFIGIAHDITERKRVEAELRNQKEWLTTLINAMPDIVCFKDGEGRWLIANQLYIETFGLEGVDILGKKAENLAEHSPNRDVLLESVASDRRAWIRGRPTVFETTIPTRGGEKIFDFMKAPLLNPDGSRKGLVVVGRDITERKLAAERIRRLAHHDSLTDLPNRVLFQERLREAIAQARRNGTLIALMFLDLDKFKDVNDTLGHYVGDLLLKAVAERLGGCIRKTDTVARLGGDEFAVLLTNLSTIDGASTVAEAIVESIAEPFQLDENEIITSTSIGITIFPHDADDADRLLKFADLALYRSKAEGRNGYHFYVSEMGAEVQARKAIERDLRQALGGSELGLHYQPLIDLRTGTITGSEALIRWFHPGRGTVSPVEFIPIAERTDLIYPIGRWVLHQACLQAAAWHRAGLQACRVAVNLSPAQFKHQYIIPTVRDVLEQTGLPPRLLQLEITESIAMQNIEASIDILGELRDLGIQVSIDDFGTGYSSLNYLKRFPVDKLKVDRSFVRDIFVHPDNAAIVRAIINLGHGIGTKVNVEGVETLDQLEFLVAHGVDEAQGFLFSRPLGPEDFAALSGSRLPWREMELSDGQPLWWE
ncbi:MAG: EAL domain-containing protein [Rhodospirillales bacterium]|nr:EAL domain-containing protein [Rhodospirillales bacterium]